MADGEGPCHGVLFHRHGHSLGGPIIPVCPLSFRLSRCEGVLFDLSVRGCLPVKGPYQRRPVVLLGVPSIIRSAHSDTSPNLLSDAQRRK